MMLMHIKDISLDQVGAGLLILAFAVYFGSVGIYAIKKGEIDIKAYPYKREEYPVIFALATGFAFFLSTIAIASLIIKLVIILT